jgi:hypothetical protein
MNLAYAKWLRLPIKQLDELKKLLNIDSTENKSGELKYYTCHHCFVVRWCLDVRDLQVGRALGTARVCGATWQ